MHQAIPPILQFLEHPTLTQFQADDLIKAILMRWEQGTGEQKAWGQKLKARMEDGGDSEKMLCISVNEAVLISSLILVLEENFPFQELIRHLPPCSDIDVKALQQELASRGTQINRRPDGGFIPNLPVMTARLDMYLRR